MIVAAGGMGEMRGGPVTAGGGLGEGDGAVCGDRKKAGWARIGRIQEIILGRAFFLFKMVLKLLFSQKTGKKPPNMHTPVRR